MAICIVIPTINKKGSWNITGEGWLEVIYRPADGSPLEMKLEYFDPSDAKKVFERDGILWETHRWRYSNDHSWTYKEDSVSFITPYVFPAGRKPYSSDKMEAAGGMCNDPGWWNGFVLFAMALAIAMLVSILRYATN